MGSEMCIRDSVCGVQQRRAASHSTCTTPNCCPVFSPYHRPFLLSSAKVFSVGATPHHPLKSPLMTPSLSPSPTVFDFDFLQAVRQVVLQTIENKVCQWEQQSLDARINGDPRSSAQYKDWAFAGDSCRHELALAFSALILDALECGPSPVKDHHEVKLPDLTSSQGTVVDVQATAS